jgi:hypothetical protein
MMLFLKCHIMNEDYIIGLHYKNMKIFIFFLEMNILI